MSDILTPGGNGAPRALRKPAAVIFWDPEAQIVVYQVDPAIIKTWEFGKAILAMAAESAERQQQACLAQQAMDAQLNQAIAQKVIGRS